jgi:hypothetical protein
MGLPTSRRAHRSRKKRLKEVITKNKPVALLQLRAEQADLEAYIRDTQLELTHRSTRALNEPDRMELSRQGQRLRAALLARKFHHGSKKVAKSFS